MLFLVGWGGAWGGGLTEIFLLAYGGDNAGLGFQGEFLLPGEMGDAAAEEFIG